MALTRVASSPVLREAAPRPHQHASGWSHTFLFCARGRSRPPQFPSDPVSRTNSPPISHKPSHPSHTHSPLVSPPVTQTHSPLVAHIHASPVSHTEVCEYARNGAVVLRGLLRHEQVELLRRGIERNMADPSPLAKVASAADDAGLFFEDFCNWTRVPEYQQLIFESPIPQAAAQLMQSRVVRLYHDHLLVKEPRTQQPTPWHQDQPYYNISGRQNVSFWIPVDPVPVESTLKFVSGSHSGAWYLPRTFLDEQAKWFPEGSLANVPKVDEGSEEILAWDLEPGDAVAFHMLTLHSSEGSTHRRRAFSVRLVGDDVRHAPRPWVTSPEFEGLASELSAGVELDHPLFPIVYPKEPTS